MFTVLLEMIMIFRIFCKMDLVIPIMVEEDLINLSNPGVVFSENSL